MKTLALFAFVATTLFAEPASAQDARAEFVAGTAAANEQRWADALEHFRRAYELSENPVALYNEGTTLRALGRYVEARDTFDRFLARHPDAGLDVRASVIEMREDVVLRIAHLEIRPPDLRGLELRIDGQLRALEGDPARFDLDPGPHQLRATAEAHQPFELRVELAQGETRAVDLVLTPGSRSDDLLIGGTIAGIAGALLAIAVGIGAGVAAQDAAQLAPRTNVVLEP